MCFTVLVVKLISIKVEKKMRESNLRFENTRKEREWKQINIEVKIEICYHFFKQKIIYNNI